MIEVETQRVEFFAGSFGFSGWIELLQNTPVAPQNIVDVAYQVMTIAVQLIVKIAAALIVAKFFIGPAVDGFPAI